MTITQLYYVLAVAEHQNFTKAAQKCFVTQPTLSMQIQKLEDQLDIQIFDRSKKPIELTEVGRKIVSQAKNIVNEADRIQDIVDQQKGFIGGEFRIGIIPTHVPGNILPVLLHTTENNLDYHQTTAIVVYGRSKDDGSNRLTYHVYYTHKVWYKLYSSGELKIHK